MFQAPIKLVAHSDGKHARSSAAAAAPPAKPHPAGRLGDAAAASAGKTFAAELSPPRDKPQAPVPNVRFAKDRVCKHFDQGELTEAALAFVDESLGALARPESCCELLRWLDEACRPGDRLARQSGASSSKREVTASALLKRIAAEGRKRLACQTQASTRARACEAYAQAFDLPGFPRPFRTSEHASELAPSAIVQGDWLMGMLDGLPTADYTSVITELESRDHDQPPFPRVVPCTRPAHAPLVNLLALLGPDSLATALLRRWAAITPAIEGWSGSALVRRQNQLLEHLLREETAPSRGRMAPHLYSGRSLDPVTVAALARSWSDAYDDLSLNAQACLYGDGRRRLVEAAHACIAPPRRERLASELPREVGPGLLPHIRPPDRVELALLGRLQGLPGTPEALQANLDRLVDELAWRAPEGLRLARQGLFNTLARPTEPGQTAVPVRGRVEQFYNAYRRALGPLVSEVCEVAASRVDCGDPALAQALLSARLRRHALNAHAEGGWLRTHFRHEGPGLLDIGRSGSVLATLEIDLAKARQLLSLWSAGERGGGGSVTTTSRAAAAAVAPVSGASATQAH